MSHPASLGLSFLFRKVMILQFYTSTWILAAMGIPDVQIHSELLKAVFLKMEIDHMFMWIVSCELLSVDRQN